MPNNMKRSSSSNSDSFSHFESPHSPLRLNSPLPSDQGYPHDSPIFVSLINSPPVDNSMATVDKFTQCTPQPSPLQQENALGHDKGRSHGPGPAVVVNRALREEGQPVVGKVRAEGRSAAMESWRPKREDMMKMAELGFRISEVVLCLISLSVMAADKTEGWSDTENTVNVIAFVHSGFQAYDVGFNMVTGKHVIRYHLRRHFNFFMDQILAYLLISASSSAATRVDDWQSNWGKDEFTEMASASVVMAFLAFLGFAVSSLISGYNLYNYESA